VNSKKDIATFHDFEELRLIDCTFDERFPESGVVDYRLEPLTISDLTLIIGDNAQGKTRLFKTLIYLRELFSGRISRIRTVFEATFSFRSSNEEIVQYTLKITPQTDINVYSESIVRNGKVLFSTIEGVLIDEVTGSGVPNFFIPDNIPALVSIADSRFKTIGAVRSFFQRIIFASALIDANAIIFNKDALVPNEHGSDLSSVLNNWKERYPSRFEKVVHEFTRCFTLVKKLDLVDQGMPGKLLALHEKEIKKQILQSEWSEGFKRTLWLITLGFIEFGSNGGALPPSLILIDEIENSLDYKTLKFVISYYKDLLSQSQVILSSHSPLVCDFIPPTDWRVFRRHGSEARGYQPNELDAELEKSLDFFGRKHWEFYVKHLASVKLHRVDK
jgi:energy-coupling factor transporter ATP-binding protein EcfA2